MNAHNTIITVGRRIGSGGKDIARMLATLFGAQLYDKELLNLAAQQSGFCKEFFEHNDERTNFGRGWLHFENPLMGGSFYGSMFSQEGLYEFQCEAIREAARKGSCVFVGRTADYVLRDMPEATHVFVTAHGDDCLERVCQRSGMEPRQAAKWIADEEQRRASYYNYYTGKKWGHSESYDLCVNSSILGLEATAQFIANFVRARGLKKESKEKNNIL